MKLPDRLPTDITEAAFGKYVEHAASDRGWLWCHVRPLKLPGNRRGKFITPASAGFPDYIMVHPRSPRLFVLEIKSADGTFTPAQRRWLGLLGRVDGIDAWWAKPEHWGRILTHLDAPAARPLTSVDDSADLGVASTATTDQETTL